ncbi:glycine zipper 2TM domain-containing protein [Eionea flava]
MSITNTIKITFFAVLALALTACANSGLTGDTYTREDARKVQTVDYGQVLSVTPVVIEGDREGVAGNLGGTIIGGIAGNSVGDGRGQAIATTIGAIIGGVAGQATEEKLTRKQGQEIQIEMDDGRTLSVVQEVKDELFFTAGDRVRLLELNGVTRVSY